MQESGDSVHLDQVLDVLLPTETLQRKLELAMPRSSSLDPREAASPVDNTAATAEQEGEEQMRLVGVGELAAAPHVRSKGSDSFLVPILQVAVPADTVVALSLSVESVEHGSVLLEALVASEQESNRAKN